MDNSVMITASGESYQQNPVNESSSFKYEVTAKDANNKGITVRHVRFL